MKVLSTTVLLALPAGAAFAEGPFAGTWKTNRAKAQFDPTGGVITIEPFGQGVRYSTQVSPIYEGEFDGVDRPGLGSQTQEKFSLKRIDDRSYEATETRNGKVIVRHKIQVSEDGSKLTSAFTSYFRKDGSGNVTTATYGRTAGAPVGLPFLGSWKIDRSLTKYDSEPTPLVITQSGDVLTMSSPFGRSQTTFDLAKSTVQVTGDNVATDVKQTVRKIDGRTFETGWARGPVNSTSVYTLSADGRTIEIRSKSIGTDGKQRIFTSVLERQ
jgi:hypothetical protein